MASKLGPREEVWSQLHGSSHVTLNLELALHEGSLGLELPVKEIDSIVVKEGEGGISLTIFSLDNLTISILQVDRPCDGRLPSLTFLFTPWLAVLRCERLIQLS
jgi:hypothetical protein